MKSCVKSIRIDMEQAERQILEAFHAGVNYYDTAYIYPGSEAAIGEIFEKNGIRDQLYIYARFRTQNIYNNWIFKPISILSHHAQAARPEG